MKLNPFISLAVLTIVLLCGCDPNDVTIYNNYEGNPNDSTGYYNIFYHDFEPDIVLDSATICYFGCSFSIDFNNDGVNDLYLSYKKISCSGGILRSDLPLWSVNDVYYVNDLNCISQIPATNTNTSIPSPIDVTGVANLPLGFLVQSTLDINSYSWFGELNDCESYILPCNSFGNDVYLGMKSQRIGSPSTSQITRNYGWMKVGVSADGKVLTLKEYAYNLIPNSPIRVGDK
jgi:hypothetical protein